jgi:hypothetical protein
MGFLDKAKNAAEQAKVAAEEAASRARGGVDDLQTKRALSSAYEEFGRVAYDLLEHDEISHERLVEAAAQIRAHKAKLDDGGSAEASPPAAPPAMPV